MKCYELYACPLFVERIRDGLLAMFSKVFYILLDHTIPRIDLELFNKDYEHWAHRGFRWIMGIEE